ncbi:MAG: metabolite traffic protein EboE [Planctomycetota bacterium]
MSDPRLTYCGNVHPAENLSAWLDSVQRWSAKVAARQPGPFGLGAWWSARCAAELAGSQAAREQVGERLSDLGLSLWTLNAFPYGGFHDQRVKEAVYRPDWADPRRVRYTLDVAEAASALVPAGAVLPISTLPLGFAGGDLRAMAANLRAVAQAFAQLEHRTGVCCVLALEPEPFCLLETAAQTVSFLRDWVWARAAGGGADEALQRRHLGVCVDLCHLAVVGEEPLAALSELVRGGVRVPKIQVSSCLELRDPAAALDELLAFDEPRYLHQTAGADGLRALDLDEVRARRGEFGAARWLRTHFHLPVFWDRDGPLGSTRAEVLRVLGSLRSPYPLLEIETYTWSVLERTDFGARGGDLVDGLCEELEFVNRALRAGRDAP